MPDYAPPKSFSPTRIAVIGNYLPRQCGIATFTTDLCDALTAEHAAPSLFAVAVTDADAAYDYPERVRFEVHEDELASYRDAAEFLNFNNVDLVCLQHEYGIFGGEAGSHILWLLRWLKMPVVTTLHTVLRDPHPAQRQVMVELAALSDRLIVMSEHSSQFLQDIYQVPAAKIDLIPHGVPDLPFVDPNFYKAAVGAEARDVILTFGLLSPNKGIENVIRAMPRILERRKNAVYIVAGATHPHIRRREGDRYRESLQALAAELGVEASVAFHNRFVSPAELVEFLGSADLYVTPYRAEAQVVSGTLAYALSAGKAIISTPYWHARELLAEDRGTLVPFENPAAIADAAVHLLDHEAERHAMRKRAYLHARGMTWDQVARRYREAFAQAHADRTRAPRPSLSTHIGQPALDRLPAIKLDHLLRLTDDTGLIQHALFSVPNLVEGYTTDDNARGLIVAVLLEELGAPEWPEASHLATKYLAFLNLAFQQKTGRFRNFLSFQRNWLEEEGSEDCHGRVVWALGTVLGRSREPGLRGAAGHLFERALPALAALESPRAWAFASLGVQQYLAGFPGDRDAQRISGELTQRLLQRYADARSPEWDWFEDSLAYANGRLPQALLAVAANPGGGAAMAAGLESLEWLVKVQHPHELSHFVPIGSEGFYPKAGQPSRFDQQPIEAGAMVSACLQALRVTGDPAWRLQAWSAFNWFLGHNDLRSPLYDPSTGGCRDGLHPDRVNENQGAESTLSFLMALLELRLWERGELKQAHFSGKQENQMIEQAPRLCTVTP